MKATLTIKQAALKWRSDDQAADEEGGQEYFRPEMLGEGQDDNDWEFTKPTPMNAEHKEDTAPNEKDKESDLRRRHADSSKQQTSLKPYRL